MASTVPPEYSQFIEQEIASGKFQSAEQVISEGLRLLRERERRREELRQKVQLGLEQLDRGECVELDDVSLGTFLDEIEDEVSGELAPRTTEGR